MRYKDKLVEKVTNCRRLKVQIVCVSMIDLNYKIKGAYKGLPVLFWIGIDQWHKTEGPGYVMTCHPTVYTAHKPKQATINASKPVNLACIVTR